MTFWIVFLVVVGWAAMAVLGSNTGGSKNAGTAFAWLLESALSVAALIGLLVLRKAGLV